MRKTYVAVQRSEQKENELTHWKYIKREKKNGKWRYYYEKTKAAGYAISSKATDVAKDKLGYDERDAAERAIAENRKAVEEYQKNKDKDFDTARKNLAEANDRVLKALDKYHKTPLGQLEVAKTKIDYGSYVIQTILKDSKRELKKKLSIH